MGKTIIRLMFLSLAILAFFVLWGCAKGGMSTARLIQPTPASNTVLTPVPAAVSTLTPAEASPPTHHIQGGGKFCENYLLQAIAKESTPDNQYKKLKDFNPDDETLSPDLKKWLELMDFDKLVAYELRHADKQTQMFVSRNIMATGLATNLEYWFILLDGHSTKFVSFSENPKLIFWDREGILKYYSVEYSDEFIVNKDWDNLTFNLLQYSIGTDGVNRLVSKEQNVKCQ